MDSTIAISHDAMSHMSATMSKKKLSKREEFKQEEVLQAVVIADSFNTRFAPLTHHRPRALLPLANLPLIDYTLEFLWASGIQSIIVFCSSHADQIKAHIEASQWSSSTSPIEVKTVVFEGCMSMGDAMREVDACSLITNDFVLVNTDVVANINLASVIEKHKMRRLKDKNTIMTMVFKHVLPCQRTRCHEDDVAVCMRKTDSRILTYQKLNNAHRIELPLEMLQEHRDVQLRYDLLDCQIYVCSPHVPTVFTDNFDYQTRDDFTRGILVDEEISGNAIYVEVIEDEYAARVTNLHMYDAISKDVMDRWVYPVVPDTNISNSTDTKYTLGRHNIYLHRDITLARDSVLKENVIIGKGTSVGSNTHITQSVIGNNCIIGNDVRLDGVYVWDNVTIGDRCEVRMSILDDGVHLENGVKVTEGCVLGRQVRVGPDVTLPKATKLMSTPAVKADDSFAEEESDDQPICEVAVADRSLVGTNGHAYLYQPPDGGDDDDFEDIVDDVWGQTVESDKEVSSSESEEEDEVQPSTTPPPDDTKMFYDEVMVTLQRALSENIGLDNLIVEINSLKHAYNIQIQEVNTFVTRAIFSLPLHAGKSEKLHYMESIKKYLSKLLPVLKNYIRSSASQKDCLYSLEDLAMQVEPMQGALRDVLYLLYDRDILEEEMILTWYNNLPSPASDISTRKKLRTLVEKFVQWLQETEEESD
ncbi:Translation initiation factor eIF-2B subunit epsilon [Lamellibrachia satsuma]|nr:Translation initiation factor eIF-2B subunit epsilon [Lamellibrachia satsuma]